MTKQELIREIKLTQRFYELTLKELLKTVEEATLSAADLAYVENDYNSIFNGLEESQHALTCTVEIAEAALGSI